MFLGYRLRELRKEKNLSQEDLGKILGVSKVSISGYEKGTRIPSMDTLIGLLDIFMVPADYLLGRELNAVCEDGAVNVNLSLGDVEIIRELHSKPALYNKIVSNPKRFFNK
ncbi:MAG: helix-turn-helix transcriptional regulator [Bacilli bacterium]|nr:helix-turn-helix transcriptional regulator [Bacilli bacterium]